MTLVEGKWVRVGKRPGPVMYARDNLRIELAFTGRTFANRWFCWDVIKNFPAHVTAKTTFHPTLAAAKARGDQIIDGLADASAKKREVAK